MKIHSIAYNGADPNYPVVQYFDKNRVLQTIDTSTITVTGNPAQRLARLKQKIQDMLDDVTPLSSLPADDPYVLSDPGLPYAFWDGNGNIVVRTTAITELVVDGTGHFIATFLSLT